MKRPLPKVSRRKIGTMKRPNLWRRMCREAAAEIMKEEDKLWMAMACKELAISPELLAKPTHSSVGLELKMKQDAARSRLMNWTLKDIKLPFKVIG